MLWEIWLFSLLIQQGMASGMFLEFDKRHHAVVNLLVLGAILVLPIEGARLLRLHKHGATIVFPSRTCCLAHLSPSLCSKGSCPRTGYKCGTARYQMPSSKLVPNGDSVVQKGEVAKL